MCIARLMPQSSKSDWHILYEQHGMRDGQYDGSYACMPWSHAHQNTKAENNLLVKVVSDITTVWCLIGIDSSEYLRKDCAPHHHIDSALIAHMRCVL